MNNTLACLGFLALFLWSMNVAGDAPTAAAAKEMELQENRKVYIRVTKRQPTPENLLKSLEIENARGDKLSEVVTALTLIDLEGMDGDKVEAAVSACYENNSYWLARVTCAAALVRLNKDKGLSLCRMILKDPDVELEAKLALARKIINAKILIGYPVLQDGLLSSNGYLRRMAYELLEQFRPYDGAVNGEAGEKIDISGLIEDTRKKAQKIIDDLDRFAAQWKETRK